MTTMAQPLQPRESRTKKSLVVALPEPSLSLDQDAEWCVVKLDGQWRQIRFHDYETLFSIPGLYERVIYDILKCDSPRVMCDLLSRELNERNTSPDTLRVLDLGAGNGIVGRELKRVGVEFVVGLDIIDAAAESAERDHPGLYENYHVTDLTDLSDADRRELCGYRFNGLTCVAALGFADIPTRAFAEAFNMVSDGGFIAFNIKVDFLDETDESGFAGLIRSMIRDGTLTVLRNKVYQHRLSTNGQPLEYTAIVGRKQRDLDLKRFA